MATAGHTGLGLRLVTIALIIRRNTRNRIRNSGAGGRIPREAAADEANLAGIIKNGSSIAKSPYQGGKL